MMTLAKKTMVIMARMTTVTRNHPQHAFKVFLSFNPKSAKEEGTTDHISVASEGVYRILG